MLKIEQKIYDIDRVICENLDMMDCRWLLGILSLRIY